MAPIYKEQGLSGSFGNHGLGLGSGLGSAGPIGAQ